MNLLTVLSTLLLAQVVSCSGSDGSNIRAVCRTDKGYVLDMFRSEATRFQEALPEIQRLMINEEYPFESQAQAIEVFYKHKLFVSWVDSKVPLTDLKVSEIHSKFCDYLKILASKANYPSDIALADYDLLSASGREHIDTVLADLKIGFKIKTAKSEAIKRMKIETENIVTRFEDIRKYLLSRPGTDSGVNIDSDEFMKTLVKDLRTGIKNHDACLKDLKWTENILKIELNRYINQKIHLFVERNAHFEADLDEGEYSWELSDEDIESLKNVHIANLETARIANLETARIENLENARIRNLENARIEEAK